MRQLDETREQLKGEPDGQRSATDPDARSMVSQAKGSGLVGYNVQTAVDAKHHLIVAHEVTNVGNDRAQLSKMAKAARLAMDTRRLQAFADRVATSTAPNSRPARTWASRPSCPSP